jgi:hypothetical protein
MGWTVALDLQLKPGGDRGVDEVLDHDDRNGKAGRQTAKHASKSGDAARRCTDSHDAIRLAWLGPGWFQVAHRNAMLGGYAYTRQA